ncbi:MAG: hypothetical protein WBE79_12910 [Candidatus Cybelea sp.]|jgi:hypothetical protein
MMNRSQLLSGIGAAGAGALLTACGADTVARTATGLVLPNNRDFENPLTRPQQAPKGTPRGYVFQVGPNLILEVINPSWLKDKSLILRAF